LLSRCDHTVDADVESLFVGGSATNRGLLDLLVNNVWGGYEHSDCRPLPMVPFWEQPLHQWSGMFTAGVRAHLTASRLAVRPDAAPAPRSHREHDGEPRRASVPAQYLLRNVSKSAVARLTWAMAQELRDHGIATVAVAPGFQCEPKRIVKSFPRPCGHA
jgi:NAD(P)-dependent dehydrogenase (short-subunit alcohol dehydrogenase family)